MWQLYLTRWIFNISSLHKSTCPAPHSSMFSILRWTDHLQQKSSKSTPPHSTVHNAVVILQFSIFALFFPSKCSLSFKLGQGSFALLGQQGTYTYFFFWGRRHPPSLYTPAGPLHKNRTDQLNSNSRFFFFPDYQLLPRPYEIVPCCTFTIHKGYYIVLHSSHSPDYPMLQPSPPFSSSE